jgi:hypothetical protein
MWKRGTGKKKKKKVRKKEKKIHQSRDQGQDLQKWRESQNVARALPGKYVIILSENK